MYFWIDADQERHYSAFAARVACKHFCPSQTDKPVPNQQITNTNNSGFFFCFCLRALPFGVKIRVVIVLIHSLLKNADMNQKPITIVKECHQKMRYLCRKSKQPGPNMSHDPSSWICFLKRQFCNWYIPVWRMKLSWSIGLAVGPIHSWILSKPRNVSLSFRLGKCTSADQALASLKGNQIRILI